MKANELTKIGIDINKIYAEIENANKRGEYKYVIAPWIYITDETKLKLMKDGFKCYEGDFDRFMNGFIIEW